MPSSPCHAVLAVDINSADSGSAFHPIIIVSTRVSFHPNTDGASLALSAVTIEAPLPHPRRNIFYVGKNYYEHAREFGGSGFDTSISKPATKFLKSRVSLPKYPDR